MINKLIKHIGEKLCSLYPDMPVYIDKIPQDFKTPSFYVRSITHSDNILLFNNRRKEFVFDIVYFPTENSLKAQEEINSVFYELSEELQFIEIWNNRVMKAYSIESNKEANEDTEELHIIATYKTIVLQDDGDTMRVLKENVKADTHR